jgi:predicted O-methyltransferase YrrM
MLNKHYPYSSKFTITRKHIYELFNDFDYKIGAELGVLRGTNARSICQLVPGVKLFCIDPWNGGSVYQHYYKRARQKLRRFNVDFMRMTSMQAVSKFEDNSLDFVYIDAGEHYFDDVMMDLICWTKKVKPGGMVTGHDYEPHCGVVRAVDNYTAAHTIQPLFVTDDRNRSFFWVKQ